MPELTAIVPSKGRPFAVADVMQEMEKTCRADTKVLWALDEDDPQYALYASQINAENIFSIPAWMPMVPKLNLAAFATESFAVAFMGDDHRPRTIGWDVKYLEALHQPGIHMVYGDDLVWGAALPTQIAMTKQLIETLGFMVPTQIKHMYCDNYWLELGRLTRTIKYLPDVIVEHMHPIVGKGKTDEIYESSNAYMLEDEQTFKDYMLFNISNDVAKVKEML